MWAVGISHTVIAKRGAGSAAPLRAVLNMELLNTRIVHVAFLSKVCEWAASQRTESVNVGWSENHLLINFLTWDLL
jgi:hypothetical protein